MTGTPEHGNGIRVPFATDSHGRVIETTLQLRPLQELLESGHLLLAGTSRMGKSTAPWAALSAPSSGTDPATQPGSSPRPGSNPDPAT
ncbi:hypothetical protein [Streptomyces ipomoeae]|uniref:hypothetical protein n=1 Tax=Streptomyces ipomoeae TaxID=103232 RepID=UPI001147676C|nr:hypothetical protein [Streptomyces ipomoeae]TQE33199.1 hypothetical protein Sipo7851_22165 [Streptomyces ipomoeae]